MQLGSIAMTLAACFGHVDVVEYLIHERATMTQEHYVCLYNVYILGYGVHMYSTLPS